MATEWVYDFMPAYRLTKDIVEGYLAELFKVNCAFNVVVSSSTDLIRRFFPRREADCC